MMMQEIAQVLEINTEYSKKLKKVVTAWEAEFITEEEIEKRDLEISPENGPYQARLSSRQRQAEMDLRAEYWFSDRVEAEASMDDSRQ